MPLTTGRLTYRGWLGFATVLIAAAAALWGWIDSGRVPQIDRLSGAVPGISGTQARGAGSRELAQPPTQYGWGHFLLFLAGSHQFTPPRTEPRAMETDPVNSTFDLNRVFDDYIDSDDPQRRRTAARAFDACVPAFLPGTGQSPSPEALIDALPPDDRRIEREAAYRSLFARCQRLVAGGRASLDDTLQTLQREPQNQAPGLRAQEALLAGRFDDTEIMVGEALSGSDPAAVASLAGIATQIAQSRQPDSVDAALLQRAHETDAALPLVACDLGLDCGPQSLWALQLCATEGRCEGDVSARLIARNAPGTVDADAVQQQRSRLLGLIQSKRVLGTADLLPR